MKIYKTTTVLSLAGLFTFGVAQQAYAGSDDSWTGCYAGGRIGYGWASMEGRDLLNNNNVIGSRTLDGGTVGGQAGCDYQMSALVFGAQLAADVSDITGSHQFINGTGPLNTTRYDIHHMATITGRLGYLFTPDALAYIKAGASWTRTDHEDYDPSPLVGARTPYIGSTDTTRNGWVAGAGFEYKILNNVSVFAEYNYMEFIKEKTTIIYTDGFVGDYSFKQDLSHFMMGANYRF